MWFNILYIARLNIAVLETGDKQTGFSRKGINSKASKGTPDTLRGFSIFNKESMKKYGDIVDLRGNKLFQSGKKVHTCTVCGKKGVWTKNWWWYGSLKDVDEGRGIIKMCSDNCKSNHEQT